MSRHVRSFLNYLFPHEHNNYKAKSIHASSLIFYIVLLLAIQFAIRALTSGGGILGYAKDITVGKVLEDVNTKRREAGLRPVVLNGKLSEAAMRKGNDMFSNNYWAHISPTGKTPWEFIRAVGYDYVYAGENLAKNFDTSDAVVAAWMNSKTHRDNLLKPEYTEMGLAIINGRLLGEETTLVVQEFGTPTGVYQASKPETKGEMTEPNTSSGTRESLLTEKVGEVKEEPVVREVSNVIQEPYQKPANTNTLSTPCCGLAKEVAKKFYLLVAGFLMFVLLLDSVYMWRFKPHRVSARTIAHIIFIGALLGAMGATGVGAIL